MKPKQDFSNQTIKSKKMNTLTFSGIVKFDYSDSDYDSYYRLLLIQEDGSKLDLIEKASAGLKLFGNNVQVNYWLSDERKTKIEITEGILKSLCGDLDAGYSKEEYNYSSWTQGTDYYESLCIGGHNLYNELQEKKGKYLLIELNFNNIKK